MKIPGAWHSKSAVVSFFERWRCYERDNPTQFKAWENLVLDNLDEGYEFLTVSLVHCA